MKSILYITIVLSIVFTGVPALPAWVTDVPTATSADSGLKSSDISKVFSVNSEAFVSSLTAALAMDVGDLTAADSFHHLASATENPTRIVSVSSPTPVYDPFLYYINQLYLNIGTFFQFHLNLLVFLKILLVLAVCGAGYKIYRGYHANDLKGEWMLDTTVMEKHLANIGASPDAIEEFKRQFGKGLTTFSLSKEKLTISNDEWNIDFDYETISRDGKITTGLLDGKMVVMIWMPRQGACRIISLRKASEHELSSHSNRKNVEARKVV
jgi:uncharacterized DUF497 family protein